MLIVALPVAAREVDPVIRIAIVQLRIDRRWTESQEAFDAQARRLVAAVVDEHAPDLIVLPEYLGFFRAAAAIRRRLPDAFDAIALAVNDRSESQLSIPDEIVEDALDGGIRVWRSIARTESVAVVPGTGPAIDDDGSVRNRLWVIDERGDVVYHQDKAFLTDIERDVIGIEPGALHDASPVEIGGVEIAFTVCLDSFYSEWSDHFGEVDLWIDLRANGEPYTQEVRDRFADALPRRVEESGTTLGASATLTGGFAGLIWEGPSFAVDKSGRRIAESPTARGESVLIVEFAPEAEDFRVSVHPLRR
ncbi:MAG: hypothetical protein EA382_17850 [Spirochaetaceae bacterium]|nr:MAG: hypothetical protein EA382_17850 [Spirochaetaceae bacterium]